MPQGRLLVDGAAEGPWNMAVDQALLEHVAPQEVWLRYYRWTPATLSLGYFQRAADRARHPPSQNCPWLRRPSGGGAILHNQELTYSLVVGPEFWAGRNSTDLYRLVHQSLIDALAPLGVPLGLFASTPGTRPDSQTHEPFLCFERRMPGDVLLEGHKVAGSAQRRLRGAILQHGSVLLARSPYADQLPGIQDLGGAAIAVETLQQAWADRLAKGLGIGGWRQAELAPLERQRSEELALERYGSSAWNFRR